MTIMKRWHIRDKTEYYIPRHFTSKITVVLFGVVEKNGEAQHWRTSPIKKVYIFLDNIIFITDRGTKYVVYLDDIHQKYLEELKSHIDHMNHFFSLANSSGVFKVHGELLNDEL